MPNQSGRVTRGASAIREGASSTCRSPNRSTSTRADDDNDDDDDDGSLWGYVSLGAGNRSGDGDSEDGSIVVVSRTSSPSPVEFMRAPSPFTLGHNRQSYKIVWPPTLPWFRFQDLLLQKFPRASSPGPQALSALRIDANADRSLLAAAAGRHSASAVAGMTTSSLDAAAHKMAEWVPERAEGEHRAQLGVLVAGDDTQQAKLAALRLFVYRVSNNLVEDEEAGEDDSKYDAIIRGFQDLGLAGPEWVRALSSSSSSSLATCTAFVERVFEAAVACAEVDVMEAMLAAGADADRPCLDAWAVGMERPIQVAARRASAKMARLLLAHGAAVDATTEEHTVTALHLAAAESVSVDLVRVLVEEGGANLYVTSEPEYFEPVRRQTALVYAAGSGYYRQQSPGRGDQPERHQSAKTFRYLLDAYRHSPAPWRNRAVFRDALIIAASLHSDYYIQLLVDAGAPVTEESDRGIGPLEAAAEGSKQTWWTLSLLIGHGTPVNRPRSRLSALHIAAAWCDARSVQLLVDNGAKLNLWARLDLDTKLAFRLGNEYAFGGDEEAADTIFQCHRTALQMALHRRKNRSDMEKKYGDDDRQARCQTALVLLSAGASLVGGELAQAAMLGSAVLIGALLDRDADPNEKDPDGVPALLLAISSGSQEVVEVLLSVGARLPAGALRAAFETGDGDLVEAVLAAGGSLDEAGQRDETILEAACRSGCYDLLREVAEKRGQTIQYDPAALCAVIFACKKQDDSKNDEEKEENSQMRLLDQILQLRSRPLPGSTASTVEGAAWGIAAFRKNERVLEQLFRRAGPPPLTCLIPVKNAYGGFRGALGFGSGLRFRYDEEGFWRQPDKMMRCSMLVPAMQAGDWGLVRRLLAAGCRPDALSMLNAIACGCGPRFLGLLIDHGADVNAAPRYDVDTPLQFAARLGEAETARLLVACGADVNGLPSVLVPPYSMLMLGSDERPDPNSWRPRSALQAAVEGGHLEVAWELLEGGAAVEGPVSLDGGASALQLAAMRGHMGAVQRLLEAGAQVNRARAERHGRTALEGAAEMGRLDMVHLLVESGAMIEEPSADGGNRGTWQYHRAIGFARRNGHETVARMLTDMRPWGRADYWRAEYPDLLDEIFEGEDEDEEDEEEDEDSDNESDSGG